MTNVVNPDESGKLTDPTDTLPPEAGLTEPPPPPEEGAMPARLEVDLMDPEEARVWLTELRSSIEDIYSIGYEATKRPRKRVLSRFEARRQLEEVKHGLDQILAAARRGLDG